ncbi:MAG: hypothetical protein R3B45_01850 [Bdellovibrionota bacterium]
MRFMQRISTKLTVILYLIILPCLTSCFLFEKKDSNSSANSKGSDGHKGRLVMFIGVDISGSFQKDKYYTDSLEFLANYIYAHLNGFGKLESPHSLFVGSIGGAKINEAKTFFPIHSFEHLDIPSIHKKLKEIFPENVTNPMTDYNSFFKQVAEYVESKNLVLRPISILMLTDGIPDSPKKGDFRSLNLEPLEYIARNITLRVLYTSANVGKNWRTKVKRQRVKIWTQDANVMKDWNAPHIFIPNKPFNEQLRFFNWINDNIDFKVRLRRVN